MAKEMAGVLSGKALHEFASFVIYSNVLGYGPLHAASKLNYFITSPLILFDWMAKKVNVVTLRTAAKMFPKAAVMEVVRLVAVNYDNVDAILTLIREKLGGAEYGVGYKFDDWSPTKVRRFIHVVTQAIGEKPPPEARPVYIVVGLKPSVDSFLRSEMELQDFVTVFRTLVGTEELYARDAIEYVHGICPCLASFVSDQAGFGPREYDVEVEQVCGTPLNEKLHRLPHAEELVMDKRHVDNFIMQLEKSKRYSMYFTESVLADEVDARMGLVTFCFRSKVCHVMPYLFPDTVGV